MMPQQLPQSLFHLFKRYGFMAVKVYIMIF